MIANILLDRYLYKTDLKSAKPYREEQIDEHLPKENKWSRSFIKSITWRAVGTLDTILISYLVTGKIHAALSIGGVELITKMALYIGHERIWEKIKWGK